MNRFRSSVNQNWTLSEKHIDSAKPTIEWRGIYRNDNFNVSSKKKWMTLHEIKKENYTWLSFRHTHYILYTINRNKGKNAINSRVIILLIQNVNHLNAISALNIQTNISLIYCKPHITHITWPLDKHLFFSESSNMRANQKKKIWQQ